MIKNGVSISEKFVCLMMKLTSKLISALLKIELIKMNLSSVKIPRKKYLVNIPQLAASPCL
jgi:hypothetical protein